MASSAAVFWLRSLFWLCRKGPRYSRWRRSGVSGEFSQVLRRRREQDFVTRTGKPPEAQSIELENAFEMGERHLHLLALAARLFECLGMGKGTNLIADIFVDVAWDPA